MRIVTFVGLEGHRVEAFDSHDFTVTPILGQAHAVVASIRASGHIGAHPAEVDQLFVVASGEARVTGAESVAQTIQAGQGAVWVAGETHATEAITDVTALVLEGEGIATAFD